MARRPSPYEVLAALASDAQTGALTNRHLQVLGHLCRQRSTAARAPGAVALALDLTPNAMSRAAARLRELGLITRRVDDQNLRHAILEPTEAGIALDRRVQLAFETGVTTRDTSAAA